MLPSIQALSSASCHQPESTLNHQATLLHPTALRPTVLQRSRVAAMVETMASEEGQARAHSRPGIEGSELRLLGWELTCVLA